MKQVMNYNKDNGLLNMIRRTDPMISDNMIGDVSTGFKNYGPNMYRGYAVPISTVSNRLNFVINYGEFSYKFINNTYDDNDIRNFYINAMGDMGAYIGSFVGGTMMTRITGSVLMIIF